MGQRRNYDRISSGVILLFALVFTIGSYRIGLGSVRHPGKGLLPFLTGLLLLIVSVSVFIGAGKGDKGKREIPLPALGRVVQTIMALGLSIGFFYFLGFVLTVFLLMLIFFSIMEARLRLKSFFIAAITTIITYLVFSVGLSVQFPAGMLGF
jgi:putative tricarboxylic transport membrane protein